MAGERNRAGAIAAGVFRAAVELSQTYSFLREQVGYLDDDDPAWHGFTPQEIREQRDLTPDQIGSVLKKFLNEFEALGALYDSVSDWWVADRPLTNLPQVTSYLELLLRSAARMAGCIENAKPGSLTVTFALIERFAPRLSPGGAELCAALRCEATAMSFREPSGPPLLGLIGELTFDSPATFCNIRSAGLSETDVCMFGEWERLTNEERLVLIRGEPDVPQPFDFPDEEDAPLTGPVPGEGVVHQPTGKRPARDRGRPIKHSTEVRQFAYRLYSEGVLTWKKIAARLNDKFPPEDPEDPFTAEKVRKIAKAEAERIEMLKGCLEPSDGPDKNGS